MILSGDTHGSYIIYLLVRVYAYIIINHINMSLVHNDYLFINLQQMYIYVCVCLLLFCIYFNISIARSSLKGFSALLLLIFVRAITITVVIISSGTIGLLWFPVAVSVIVVIVSWRFSIVVISFISVPASCNCLVNP